MAEKPTELIVLNHDNGKPETVGFFIVHKGFETNPVMRKGVPLSPDAVMRWNSLYDASAWVRKKAGEDLMIAVMTASPDGQPIVWALTQKAKKAGQPDLWRISYIGSYRYNSGKLVDTTIVGTDLDQASVH